MYFPAIESMANILENYDNTKRFPMFGDGAKFNNIESKVEYVFAVNGNTFSPKVLGVEGIKASKDRLRKYFILEIVVYLLQFLGIICIHFLCNQSKFEVVGFFKECVHHMNHNAHKDI